MFCAHFVGEQLKAVHKPEPVTRRSTGKKGGGAEIINEASGNNNFKHKKSVAIDFARLPYGSYTPLHFSHFMVGWLAFAHVNEAA
jgi:hypothetical protein